LCIKIILHPSQLLPKKFPPSHYTTDEFRTYTLILPPSLPKVNKKVVEGKTGRLTKVSSEFCSYFPGRLENEEIYVVPSKVDSYSAGEYECEEESHVCDGCLEGWEWEGG
jgi:hypothetical protein